MDVNQRIDELRLKKGWSLSQLAKEALLSESTVYDWYNENHFTPSRRAIEAVCDALEISLARFYCDIDIDNLTEKEMYLLELFRQLPEHKQDSVITIVKNYRE